MIYRITIVQIDTITKQEKVWQKLMDDEGFERVQEENIDAKQYGYQEAEVVRSNATTIYEQSTNHHIDLKAIIDAFNKRSEQSADPASELIDRLAER